MKMLVFSALFALMVLDALANGPKLVGPRLYAVALAAVLAVAVQHSIGFVAAELLLLAAFTEAAFLERQRKQEEEEKARALKAQAGKVDDKEISEPAKQYLLTGRDLFIKNTASDVNAFGQPWTVQASSDGVTIFRSDYPNQKCKWWKVEAEVAGRYDTIKSEMLDYDMRTKWDTGVQSGKILKTWNMLEAGEPSLCLFYTAPQAGGAVSSRELLDLGLLSEKDGGFDYVNCSPPKSMTFKESPSRVIGERAFTHQGSGMRITPIPGTNRYKYVLISALDLGGWLPSGIINSATTGALTDSTKAMISHLNKSAV